MKRPCNAKFGKCTFYKHPELLVGLDLTQNMGTLARVLADRFPDVQAKVWSAEKVWYGRLWRHFQHATPDWKTVFEQMTPRKPSEAEMKNWFKMGHAPPIPWEVRFWRSYAVSRSREF